MLIWVDSRRLANEENKSTNFVKTSSVLYSCTAVYSGSLQITSETRQFPLITSQQNKSTPFQEIRGFPWITSDIRQSPSNSDEQKMSTLFQKIRNL